MKTISRIAFAFSCLAATANTFAMDAKGWASTYESMAAFEDKGVLNEYYNNRPGYVKPIIDNLGNVLNSNWYVSANVPQSLTFEVGMPRHTVTGKEVRSGTLGGGMRVRFARPSVRLQ